MNRCLLWLMLTTAVFSSISCRGCEGEEPRKARSQAAPQAPTDGGGWRSLVGNLAGEFLGTDHGAFLYAYDSLGYPGTAIELSARLLGEQLSAVPGAKIGFYQGQTLVGSAITDGDGLAKITWRPPTEGNFEFTVRILEVPDPGRDSELLQASPQPLLVCACSRQARFVVVDLDYTLVGSSFTLVLLGMAQPAEDSLPVMQRLSQQYRVIYLTQRPDLMTARSKGWLRDNRYPPGPLMMTTPWQLVGGSGEYKRQRLEELKKTYPNLEIGIGDKVSDVVAYSEVGMTAYLIPHYKLKEKSIRNTYRDVATLQGRQNVQVVSSWRQIEEGIFDGRKFPVEAFLKYLQDQQRTLPAKEDEDHDDD